MLASSVEVFKGANASVERTFGTPFSIQQSKFSIGLPAALDDFRNWLMREAA